MSRAICMKCFEMMRSNHRHDFVRCECGESFIDGGDDYFRAGGYAIRISEDPKHSEEALTAEQFLALLEEMDKEDEQEKS